MQGVNSSTGLRKVTVHNDNDLPGGFIMIRTLRCVGAITALFAATLGTQPVRAEDAPLRIGVNTFLSGPAAGPFGVPAKNAADLMIDVFNKGGQIPGYEKKGFGGRALEVVYVDEAGGPTKVVTEYRNLVARQDVDIVIGVISSGDCLAVAPVAEELKKFTILFDCATNRIFEEASYHYVFRTTTMATQENVAAARYIVENYPNLKKFSGINPNYAWGQDAWADFTESLKILRPAAGISTNVTPKLGAGLCVLPPGHRVLRRQGCVREGAGNQQDPKPQRRPAHSRIGKSEVRIGRRHGRHGAGQGPPGRAARALRDRQESRRQAHAGQHQGLPAKPDQPTRRHEERRLDPVRLQTLTAIRPGPGCRIVK